MAIHRHLDELVSSISDFDARKMNISLMGESHVLRYIDIDVDFICLKHIYIFSNFIYLFYSTLEHDFHSLRGAAERVKSSSKVINLKNEVDSFFKVITFADDCTAIVR
jgi:hypothetical protein